MTGSERSIARAQVRFKTKVVVETQSGDGGVWNARSGIGGRPGTHRCSGRRFRTRQSRGRSLIGGVSGCLVGAGLSMALVPVFYDASNSQTGLPLLFLTHLAIFAGIGAAGGLALGWSLGDRRVIVRCMIGGIVGALVGTLVFEVTNFVAFPNLRTFEPVPVKTIPRLIMHFCVGGRCGCLCRAGRRESPSLVDPDTAEKPGQTPTVKRAHLAARAAGAGRARNRLSI